MIVPGGIQQRSGVSYPLNSTSSNRSARALLIAEVLGFVRAARHVSGITRIALTGSLTTNQPHPKDADLLVSVTQDADLDPLARLRRRPRGRDQSFNRGGDVFLVDPRGDDLGRIRPWKGCGPGIRRSCDARHCGRRHHPHDDWHTIRPARDLIAAPPLELWPQQVARVPLPEDLVRGLLFSPSKESHTMTRIGKQPPRYRFILNPYPEERFVFCPECDGPTESRKFPLVIHVGPRNPVTLNKTCRYCPRCDLLIAHWDELEEQLVVLFEKRDPELIGNDYLVIGTLDHEVWERGCQTPLTIQEMLANLHDFQVVLRIDPADREGSLPARGFKKPPPRDRPGSARRKPPSPSVAPGAPAERNLGRNDPCWCGSGKKYKNCHMRQNIK